MRGGKGIGSSWAKLPEGGGAGGNFVELGTSDSNTGIDILIFYTYRIQKNIEVFLIVLQIFTSDSLILYQKQEKGSDYLYR
jgi:hypothetical protein